MVKVKVISLNLIEDDLNMINRYMKKGEFYCQSSSLKQFLTQYPASSVGHMTVSSSHVTQSVSPVGHVIVSRSYVTHSLYLL